MAEQVRLQILKSELDEYTCDCVQHTSNCRREQRRRVCGTDETPCRSRRTQTFRNLERVVREREEAAYA